MFSTERKGREKSKNMIRGLETRCSHDYGRRVVKRKQAVSNNQRVARGTVPFVSLGGVSTPILY